MPELDPTSPYAHLINLVRDYKEIIDLTESGALETDDIRELNGQRSVLHDQIIDELARLNIPAATRKDAMQKAYQIAQWYPAEE